MLRALRRGITPSNIGLMMGGAIVLLRAVNHDWQGYLISLLAAALALYKPWNPLWLIAGGALIGIAGLV
mgnify:FL=1